MMTGSLGWAAWIRSTAARPSMRGISTSSVTTSGNSSSTLAMASRPSQAVPTISMSAS